MNTLNKDKLLELAKEELRIEDDLIYVLRDGVNYYEIRVTQAAGSREIPTRAELASQLASLVLSAAQEEREPSAFAVVSKLGGIHKLSIKRDSAERKAEAWRAEWPNNECAVRQLYLDPPSSDQVWNEALEEAAAICDKSSLQPAIAKRIRSLKRPLQAQEPADPMDWPLPCDIIVGAGTIKKGCKLSVLVARMNVLHKMAQESAFGSSASSAVDRQPSPDELPPLPNGRKALFPCEDCEGTGCTGEMIPATFIEPAEPVLCSTCNGSGRGYEAIAYEADDMREYAALSRAQAAQQAQVVSDLEARDRVAKALDLDAGISVGDRRFSFAWEYLLGLIEDLVKACDQSAAPVSEQPAAQTAETAGVPEFSEEAWEAKKAELSKQYPGIAGEYKVFEVAVITESGCDPSDGEFSVHISKLVHGFVSDDDLHRIRDAIWEEIKNLNLPEEGVTDVLVYESGEREDVFWNKYYRIAHPQAAQAKKEGDA